MREVDRGAMDAGMYEALRQVERVRKRHRALLWSLAGALCALAGVLAASKPWKDAVKGPDASVLTVCVSDDNCSAGGPTFRTRSECLAARSAVEWAIEKQQSLNVAHNKPALGVVPEMLCNYDQ